VTEDGHKRCLEHLDLGRLRNEVIRIAREDLHINETYYDIDSLEKELFVGILEKLLPFNLPPPQPAPEGRVFCEYHHKQITRAQWDSFYGRFKRFMDNEKVYREVINQALERKNR
jgi:hypothetical protein